MGVPLVSLFYSFFIFLILSSSNITAQTSSTDTDFSCSLNSSLSCDTYVTYRARPPNYFDVGSISDLLEVSRLSIAKATGLASEDTELFPDQLLLVPVKCYCNGSHYFSNVTYQIKKGDSFYSVSIGAFENLTNYHLMQDMNPALDPTNLTVGEEAVFPLFCKCPARSDLEKGLQYLVTYVWQPWDGILTVSNMFGASAGDILAANNCRNFTAAICLPVLIPATINDQVVAVKKTKQASEELAILQKLNHGNLVKLMGVSSDDHGNFFLVYEYAESGSLDQWLFPRSSSISSSSGSEVSLGWSQRLHIALDVANALQYLHEHTQPSIVHGDIRTCSILLDSRFKAKIASFSTAKHATNSMMLKGDVFAFGLVLLELLSGKKAVEAKDEIEGILEVEDNREEKFRRWMDPKLRFYPVDDALNLAAVAKVCTSEKSAERPRMTDIVFNLCFLTQSSFEVYGKSWTSGEADEIVQIVSPVIAR
ncbi:hypothetical protein RND71_034176 [Anisodus tanguticus]|uniref:Protein kinase domain-containing protein n=1 Tax=Anisodus tanguticus TaxID=243964 RepID=A0AAE1RC61_9SOLA|nr:hypothetical protein RND71_034176 [Anisodus tanguticus]